VFKGDTAVKLIMTLSDGGNLYKIGRGCEAWFAFRKPNIEEPIVHACDTDGDCIIYTFYGTTADTVGVFECELTLVDDNGRVITAPKLVLDVAEKDVENDEDFPEFDENSKAIAKVLGAVAKEDNREYQESIRQANEEQRQTTYENAMNTADEAKTISQEAYSKAKSAVLEVDRLVETINANYERFADATLTYETQTGHLVYTFIDQEGSYQRKSVDLPLESSIVKIDEIERDGKIYLKLELASGETSEIELDDLFKLKSEWDFIIDTYDKLGEISNMHGNVLITCPPPSSDYALSVPERVKYLKIDARLSNANSFSSISHDSGSSGYDSECIFDGSMCDFGDDCSISSFKEVRNVITKGGEITYCGYVFNCTAQTVSECTYVDILALESSDNSAAEIIHCLHVCHVYNNCSELNIADCEIVEEIVGQSTNSLEISNAISVNLVRGFRSVAYTDCQYVNPHTCQGYVVQQDAVGKVQVLTADGSFDAIDINGIVDSINGIEEELTMINEGGIE
jgi:hypothetical protein